ncbi:MAG: BrnT family toxin [Bacteriovoracia bacterium]
MEITWDDRKEEANIKKHGVDFGEAVTVICNPLSLYRMNAHPSENRFEYIGHSDRDQVLFVVTVEEIDDVVHIISARKAEPDERKEYEEGR